MFLERGRQLFQIPFSFLLVLYRAGSRINDVWRSVDKGSSWSLITSSASWSGREGQATVVLDSNTIVLMGGILGVGGK